MSSKIFLYNQEIDSYPVGQKIKITIDTDDGKLEGIYGIGSKNQSAPTLLLFHPQPNSNGTMYNDVLQNVLSLAMCMGFVVLVINFSGVGNSINSSDDNTEFHDAIAAFKWLCTQKPYSKSRWVFGFSFGAYIAAQLAMRRPEIDHFIFLSMPIGVYDISFFSPCPVEGLFIRSHQDTIVSEQSLIEFFVKNDKCKNISYYKSQTTNSHFFKNVSYETDLFPSIYKYIKTHCPNAIIPNEKYENILNTIEYLRYDDFLKLANIDESSINNQSNENSDVFTNQDHIYEKNLENVY